MSFKNKNILAVIPARGGSKGVLRKNLRQIHGKSLITHAADCVNQLSWIDAVVLSSDDEEICAHAQNANIDAPLSVRMPERPPSLSTRSVASKRFSAMVRTASVTETVSICASALDGRNRATKRSLAAENHVSSPFPI